MKILIAAPTFFPYSFGGGEMYAYRLAKELLRRGHLVEVLCPLKWDESGRSREIYEIKEYQYENIPVISFCLNVDKISYLERSTGYGSVTFEILEKIC